MFCQHRIEFVWNSARSGLQPRYPMVQRFSPTTRFAGRPHPHTRHTRAFGRCGRGRQSRWAVPRQSTVAGSGREPYAIKNLRHAKRKNSAAQLLMLAATRLFNASRWPFIGSGSAGRIKDRMDAGRRGTRRSLHSSVGRWASAYRVSASGGSVRSFGIYIVVRACPAVLILCLAIAITYLSLLRRSSFTIRMASLCKIIALLLTYV
jgi:hypothetical protein